MDLEKIKMAMDLLMGIPTKIEFITLENSGARPTPSPKTQIKMASPMAGNSNMV